MIIRYLDPVRIGKEPYRGKIWIITSASIVGFMASRLKASLAFSEHSRL